MGKHGKFSTRPWLTSKQGGATSSFVMLDVSLMKDPAFLRLSHATRIVYIAMAEEAQGNGRFLFPAAKAAEYGFAPATLRRAVSELTGAGFLQIVTSGKDRYRPTEYAFAFDWKGETPEAQRRKAQRKEREKTAQEIQEDKAMATAAAEAFVREWATKNSD